MKALLVAAALAIAGPALAQTAHDTNGMAGMSHEAQSAGAAGSGVVKKIDLKAGSIVLQHGPIAALNWPAMTMTFKADAGLLKGLKVGQKVDFNVEPGPTPEVVAIKPAG